ncbi:unnamed protein product [Lactuca saligna]|uniref:Uncharacterized protein n=1 Tax=Lactuca saligna TaxID=75948 RepID=A0AA35YX55_LACSI|nr:unnamed protein product [Lactuca saligna]
MASQLKFVDSHNIIGYLLDPPIVHNEFKSMIMGLNSCRSSYALHANPVIQGNSILKKMCYKGTYPPTIKKLLPPYWRNEKQSPGEEEGPIFDVSQEPINETMISPTEIEKEINIFKQPNNLMAEQMEDLIEKLQSTMRKPPQTVHVTTEPPFESDNEDSAHIHLLRKRKEEIQDLECLSPTLIKLYLLRLSLDFESPILEQEVLPSQGAQTYGSSFEAPELDISKGKGKQPESKFVDVSLLQNRVFDLE